MIHNTVAFMLALLSVDTSATHSSQYVGGSNSVVVSGGAWAYVSPLAGARDEFGCTV
jgi:hypothetical protein